MTEFKQQEEQKRLGTIFTIGHGAKPILQLIGELRAAKITTLVDVRQFPGSRKHPHFGQDKLSEVLKDHGITYLHLIHLGGRRTEPKNSKSPHIALRVKAFKAYASHMRTGKFLEQLDCLCDLASKEKVAYMCSETVWWKCHRRMISDLLVARHWKVVHLGLSAKNPPCHEIWCCGRVDENKHLVYDQLQQEEKSVLGKKKKKHSEKTSSSSAKKQRTVPNTQTLLSFFGEKTNSAQRFGNGHSSSISNNVEKVENE